MKYFILPLTWAICLHYMLEAQKMTSLKMMNPSDAKWFCFLCLGLAVTVTIGRFVAWADADDLPAEERKSHD